MGYAREARRELIRAPKMRGRAPTFGAFITGATALALGLGSLNLLFGTLNTVMVLIILGAGLAFAIMLVV